MISKVLENLADGVMPNSKKSPALNQEAIQAALAFAEPRANF
jgi:uncharacterized protein (DUF433 family)